MTGTGDGYRVPDNRYLLPATLSPGTRDPVSAFALRPSFLRPLLMRSDPQAGGRQDNVAQEGQQGADEHQHGGDEEDGHDDGDVDLQQHAGEDGGDDDADEQGAGHAERDGDVDHVGALREDGQLVVQLGDLHGRRLLQLLLQHAAAVDDPAEAVGEDRQKRTDAGEEEDGGQREPEHI